MKKVLGFVGAAIYAAIVALILNQLVFWVTPWFMSQKGWFLIFFWVVLSTPLFYLAFTLSNMAVGIPTDLMAKGSSPRIIPTIIFVVVGVMACFLPWSLDIDYGNTLNICYAVTETICIVVLFILQIVAIWTMRHDS